MKITKKSLDDAVDKHIISAEQAEKLYQHLKSSPSTGPSFDFTHVLYYLGGLIAIGAMTLFMTLGWEAFGGWGIFFISLGYGAVGLKLTQVFRDKGYAIPAGICATFAVALTPLAIYGLQQGLGLWPNSSTYQEYHRYIQWHWLYMELGTLVSAAIVLWRYKYPFLVMPIAVTLWYMSMDVASMLLEGYSSYEQRGLITMYFGIAMVCFAFYVDVRTKEAGDYAFWLYLFGVMAFWCGLTSQDSDSEVAKFFYLCTNILMIFTGVVLMRRVFVIFGALGASLYIGYLAFDVFKESWFFPISLTFIGLSIIYLGVLWQKNEAVITKKVRQQLPAALQNFLDSKAV